MKHPFQSKIIWKLTFFSYLNSFVIFLKIVINEKYLLCFYDEVCIVELSNNCIIISNDFLSWRYTSNEVYFVWILKILSG